MTREKVPKLPTTVTVQYDDGFSCKAINVVVNDRGPFAVDKKGRATKPLAPHPTHIIDLTNGAFERLSGGSAAAIGVIPVMVTVP